MSAEELLREYNTLKGGQPETLKYRTVISLQEKGVHYRARLNDGQTNRTAVMRVDGELISDCSIKKCDNLILVENDSGTCNGYFIELKGGDVERGVQQLMDTVNHPNFGPEKFCKRFVRIVTRNGPRAAANKTIRSAEENFRKRGCHFRTVMCKNTEILDATSSR